jgi:hypothetical protein
MPAFAPQSLTVSRPDDPYEREADRVADQVMRMPDGQWVAQVWSTGNVRVMVREEMHRMQRKEPINPKAICIHPCASEGVLPRKPGTRSHGS